MISAQKDGVYVRLKIEVEAKGGDHFDPVKALEEMCEQLQGIQDMARNMVAAARSKQ